MVECDQGVGQLRMKKKRREMWTAEVAVEVLMFG